MVKKVKGITTCRWVLYFLAMATLCLVLYSFNRHVERWIKNEGPTFTSSKDNLRVTQNSKENNNQFADHAVRVTNMPRQGHSDALPTSSPYAYVTLISGIDSSRLYRGFFYNALLMKKSLAELGSTADFIVMLGFDEKNTSFFDQDAALLKSFGIKIFILPRFVDDVHGLSFAEMALLKITPWSFSQYQKVQFFDGDIFPTSNMDCFFQLNHNAFTVGAASPLNSGWYLAIPNHQHFIEMRRLALWRLGRDWDKVKGWGNSMPTENPLFYRGGGKPCLLWDFNGADMDQGLLTHYFVFHHGNALLMDTVSLKVRLFTSGLMSTTDSKSTMAESVACCSGKSPTSHFLHFTGQRKPWVKTKKSSLSKSKSNAMWMKTLFSLNLTIAGCVALSDCKSPLGYWNRDFPKGGLKTIPELHLKEYSIG